MYEASRSRTVLSELFRVDFGSDTSHDVSMDDLSPVLIRLADDDRLVDGRMLGDDVLDLQRMEVLAAANDHVVGASGEVEIALFVPASEVSGAKPASGQRLRRAFRHLQVAVHGGVAPPGDLADLARLDITQVDVDESERHTGGGSTDRSEQVLVAVHGPSMILGREHGLQARLGAGTEGIEELALERPDRPVEQCGRHRCRPVHHQFESVVLMQRRFGLGEQ